MKQYQVELMKLALMYNDMVDELTQGIKQFGQSQELVDKRNEAIAGYANTMAELYKAIGASGSARPVSNVELKSVVLLAEEVIGEGWMAELHKNSAA